MPPEKYPFPHDPERSEYRLFPAELEDDEHVFFHGTAACNLGPILDNGFSIPIEPPSVSFAKNSALALGYASAKRTPASPDGCVLAVRYEKLDRPGLKVEVSMLHDYTCNPQPEIIGYCIVPASYRHV
jgi:hypothetical protein